MSLFESLPKREDTYESLMRNLSFYEKYLNSVEVNGEEGVVEGLSAMLIGLGDISMRLLTTMRTNLFAFYKNFKRSEMREYFEGHMVSVKRIEGVPFNTFMNVDVPAPAEMTARYMSAVEAVDNHRASIIIQCGVNDVDQFVLVHTFTSSWTYGAAASRGARKCQLRIIQHVNGFGKG